MRKIVFVGWNKINSFTFKALKFKVEADSTTKINIEMSIKRLFDFAHNALEKYPQDDMFVTKYHGNWQKTSTKEYINLGIKVSRGLL